MAKWDLCFALLLPLAVCYPREETLVKTIASVPDVTPICSNSTLDIITLIVCKIRTQRARGEECRLLYRYKQDYNISWGDEKECKDSKFRLVTENQTVFLNLTSLIPADNGNYSCECVRPDGTFIWHLNVTVEASQKPLLMALIGVSTVIIIAGVILELIYRRTRNGSHKPDLMTTGVHHKCCAVSLSRGQEEPLRSPPNSEPEDIEPYSTFIRRESGLYSTARVQTCTDNANKSTSLYTPVEEVK